MNKFKIAGKVKKCEGSLTVPENAGLRMVFSLVPDNGNYTSNTSVNLSKRWSKVKETYKLAYVNRFNFKLGNLLTTPVSSDIWVVQGIVFNKDNQLDLDALNAVVKKLVAAAAYDQASVHVSQSTLDEAPDLLAMLEAQLLPHGYSVYVYPRV